MLGSEVLAQVAELQAAFGKTLSQDTKNIWIRELEPFDLEDMQVAVRNIIRTEERFPSLATMLKYLGEADREKGIKAIAVECHHLSKLREVSYDQVLQGHLAMCRENLAITGEEEWDTRIGWCEELLRREIA